MLARLSAVMIRARENNKIVYYFYWRAYRDTFAVFYVGLLKRALTTVLMSVYTGGANATYIFVGVDQPEARSGPTIALFAAREKRVKNSSSTRHE